jgi:hypothetical protein
MENREINGEENKNLRQHITNTAEQYNTPECNTTRHRQYNKMEGNNEENSITCDTPYPVEEKESAWAE